MSENQTFENENAHKAEKIAKYNYRYLETMNKINLCFIKNY